MPEVALQTLDLVGRELNNTLGEARTALETFVEQPENVVLLQRCVSDLHQVQGVLRLLGYSALRFSPRKWSRSLNTC